MLKLNGFLHSNYCSAVFFCAAFTFTVCHYFPIHWFLLLSQECIRASFRPFIFRFYHPCSVPKLSLMMTIETGLNFHLYSGTLFKAPLKLQPNLCGGSFGVILTQQDPPDSKILIKRCLLNDMVGRHALTIK